MIKLRISCLLPPSKQVPVYARLAEELGYETIFLCDSPALYGDIWTSLGRIASATSRIGVGTAVCVPSLRHPLVTASAIASIEDLAPGRVVCGFGAGHITHRSTRQKSMRSEDMRVFFQQLRALLAGEAVEIDGDTCRMTRALSFAPKGPINLPIIAAVSEPEGYDVVRAEVDGVFCGAEVPAGFARCLQVISETVLGAGDDHDHPRVPAATMAVDGEDLATLADLERPTVDAMGIPTLQTRWIGDAERIREHMAEASKAGVTEIVKAMSGPDIEHELKAFSKATGLKACTRGVGLSYLAKALIKID